MDLFVVGAGYVGLTTAVGFCGLGHRVVVHDVDEARIAPADGRSPIFEPGLEAAIRTGLESGSIRFTTDPAPDPDVMVAIVCVPTPSRSDGLLDTVNVESVVGDRDDRASVVINPEFMREGRALADFAATSRVVVGGGT